MLLRHELALENVAVHQIVIHGLRNDLGDRGRSKFDESVMLGAASHAVAGETKTGNVTELGEISAHLVFIETMGDTSDKS